MTEDDARRLLLVRAVEQEDRDGLLLTAEDRMQADAFARGALAEKGRDVDATYLARRAEFAARRLETRHPAIGKALQRSRWPSWPGVVVPLAALVLGIAANELGNGRRLDLLAFPLLGTFAWNLVVYVSIALHPLLRRARAPGSTGSASVMARIAGIGQRAYDRATPVARALHGFVGDWARASGPLAAARSARTLHLGAAMFAVGLVAGIYLRALAVEYRAGWESTFLGPGAVHALLSALLGPASAVTGVPLPDTAGVAALRWDRGGANAGPWIHLYTATTVGFVVIPRLLLAGWAALRIARLAHAFPVPGREDFYVRRLLRAAKGGAGSVRITPYACRPEEDTRQRLERLLREALGDAMQVRFDEPVDYGTEDAWMAGATLRPDDDHHIVLYSLSATPEAENHGAFAAALATRLAAERNGTLLAAIVDESAFRRHFARQAGLDDRVATRRKAWTGMLAPAGLAPLSIDLAMPDTRDVERLEGALVSSAGLEARA